ncbi:MAG TPA: phospholipase D-like domain-containing protein [Alphaproteobacteria bacterium]|nr:phospholipase D-like domain-containing protein [Alphaproteobacteria bacterium]
MSDAAIRRRSIQARVDPHVEGDAETLHVLKPGRNCWQVCDASRVAFLIDGADYFLALRDALLNAQSSVLISGWDFDPNIRLDPINRPDESIGALLAALTEARPSLRVRILIWGFSTFYGANHQPAVSLSEPWHAPLPRVDFAFDDAHPLGSSHHEKIVCIDDSLVFLGGIDLTAERWDTPAHDLMDPRRLEYDGKPYLPVHDLQMAVEGEAARAISLLMRNRWRAAANAQIEPAPPTSTPWPEALVPVVCDTRVAIARTRAPYGDDPGVREVEALNIDALRAARNTIYLETQYFTAQSVGDVLAARLEEPDGPEVIVVVTKESEGLVEQFAMGSNRERLFRRLKAADRYDRFRAYYAIVPSPDGGSVPIGIHSKLIIVDNRFVRIGSSNLNNRSMGVDSECDIAIEATRGDERAAVTTLRNRLLAEHLGTDVETLSEAIAAKGSVRGAIESIERGPRGLCPCRIDVQEGDDEPIAGTAILDPIEPINFAYLRQVLSF